ncbi:MAG TPA: STAS domain-containing protein [Solirubrobacteraceae bacterium]|jgi:anti-anti-sigma factor
MERHLTTSTVSIDKRNEGSATVIGANRTNTAFGENTHERPAENEPRSMLGRASGAWMHTLVVTGELTYRSAHALEVEIERLCETGITGITLDLRQLTRIDPIGVAVIAFRCGLCRRQGYDFELIPGPRFVHRAFEQAGVIGLLSFQNDEIAARRLRVSISGQRSRDGCEQ